MANNDESGPSTGVVGTELKPIFIPDPDKSEEESGLSNGAVEVELKSILMPDKSKDESGPSSGIVVEEPKPIIIPDKSKDVSGPSKGILGAEPKPILIPDKSKVTFYNVKHKLYLSAQRLAMAFGKPLAKSFEQFEATVAKDCSVMFKTYHKTYMRATLIGSVRHTSSEDKRCVFNIELNEDGTVHLTTYCGYYVNMGNGTMINHIKKKDASTFWVMDVMNPHHDADMVLCITPTQKRIIEGRDNAYHIVLTEFPNILLDDPFTVEQNTKPKKGSKYFKGSVDYAHLPDLYDATDLVKFAVPLQSRSHDEICFMSASENGAISRNFRIQTAELFHIERHPSSPHKVSFRTFWGTYLSVYKDKKLAQSKLRTNSEFFIVRRFGEGVVLQANNGKFVILDEDGSYRLHVERIIHTQFHFHGSFAVPRSNIDARFYIDGEEYFSAIYKALSAAEECIYITGWFLSPNMYLIRPANDPEHILSTVLYTAAKKGVKVYILLWNNIESVAPNKHAHAKSYLEGLHQNITVSLRPHTRIIPSSWSHHQKSVMIDNKIAFVGGLDLCLYRWDNHEHNVVEKVPRTFFGKDYYNSRFTSALDLEVHRPFDKGGVDKTQHPRMPWHDVHMSVDGPACADIVRNFVQRWNHNRITKRLDFKEIASGNGKGEYVCQVLRSISHESIGHHSVESSIREAYCRTIAEADSFVYIENQYFIDPVSPKLITRAITDRIKRAIVAREQFKIVVVLPQYPDNGDPTTSSNSLVIMFWQKETISAIENEINHFAEKMVSENYISFYSLRNYGVLGDRIVTEQIYVHSKVMISDKAAVIGSANINARSMLGNRDTELSVLVKGPKFGTSLVCKLLSEHTGVPEYEISPNITQFLKEQWHYIAKTNTGVYREIFQESIPDGEPSTIEEYRNAVKFHVDTSSLPILQSQIQGHLVLFPGKFLTSEKEGNVVAFKWQFILNAWRKVSDLLN